MSATKTQPRMTADELFAEVDWLLEADVHPALIAQELLRSASSIESLARSHGRPDIALAMSRVVWDARKAAA